MPSPRALPAFALLLALLALPVRALAEEDLTGADTALKVTMGKALLEEGKKLLRQGNLAAARGKLVASVRDDPTPEALLELGACQEKLGATASAWGTLHRAEERARTLGDKVRAGLAAKRAAALDPRLSRVLVRVTASSEDPKVTIDDRWVLAKTAWGVALPLDPGSHKLIATWLTNPDFITTFDLNAEGETREVTVPAPFAAPAPKPEAPPAPEEPLPGETLPILEKPRASTYASYPSPPWIPPSSSRPMHPQQGWVGVGLICAGALNLLPVAGLYIGGTGHASDALVGGLVINGGVGLLTGVAGIIVVATAPKSRWALTPLRLRMGPMVARSGGGLTFHGAF